MSDRNTKELELLALAAFTNTTEAFTTERDVARYAEILVLLRVTNKAGTSPTLTLKLYTKSVQLAKLFFTHSTIVNALDISTTDGTDANNILTAYTFTNVGEKIRMGYKIGGTVSPSATFGLYVVGKN